MMVAGLLENLCLQLLAQRVELLRDRLVRRLQISIYQLNYIQGPMLYL